MKHDAEGWFQLALWAKQDGQWMSYDDMMAAKGLVKVEGKWVTAEIDRRLDRSLQGDAASPSSPPKTRASARK